MFTIYSGFFCDILKNQIIFKKAFIVSITKLITQNMNAEIIMSCKKYIICFRV